MYSVCGLVGNIVRHSNIKSYVLVICSADGLLSDCLFLPPENMSLLTSRRTATPMLSLVITLFSMTSEPSELAMATWLNSTVCFWIKVNLQKHP